MLTLARRSRFRLGFSCLVAAGAAFAGGVAHADATASPTSKCETTLECSSGQAALKATSRTRLNTSIDTGWLPSCGNGQDHCGGSPLQVRAAIALDAPNDASESLIAIDMPQGAVVDATWADKEFITLKLAAAGRADGSFKIAHTLVPTVSVYVGILLNQEFSFNETDLLNKAPGSHFDYYATGTSAFSPWGLDGAQVTVNGPDLANTELFSKSFADLPGINSLIDGQLAISATSSPAFTYKTTKVHLTGSDAAITAASGVAKIKSQNQDYLDVQADVEGLVTFAGEMEIVPNVTVSRISSLTLPSPLKLPINVGIKKAYDNAGAPITMVFPKQMIHIPLPNVSVPSHAVDFGTVKNGEQGEQTIKLGNTGELGAMLSFESSDPQFSIATAHATTGPKSQYPLVVRFSPTAMGDAEATITVKSNDPDSPVQTFKVSGTSSTASAPPTTNAGEDPKAPAASAPGQSGGCGCRVTSPTGSDAGGFALVGLAVLGFVRRRRSPR